MLQSAYSNHVIFFPFHHINLNMLKYYPEISLDNHFIL